MGSLDDAIREHLELKRRLGASDDEIKEKETEAFGKGNRPAPAPPEPEPALRAGRPRGALHRRGSRRRRAGDERPAQHRGMGPGRFSSSARTSTADEIFEPDEVPADESPDRARRTAPARGLAAESAEEPAEEDVLEETPEFLEETPEHDRLWFEQRPPKDFDFD